MAAEHQFPGFARSFEKSSSRLCRERLVVVMREVPVRPQALDRAMQGVAGDNGLFSAVGYPD